MQDRPKSQPPRDRCAEIREDAHARRCRRIREDLERRGVPKSVALRLAAPLEAALSSDREDVYEALLTGASLTQNAAPFAGSKPERKPKDELCRVLSSVTSELRKLEENMDVLRALVVSLKERSPDSDRPSGKKRLH